MADDEFVDLNSYFGTENQQIQEARQKPQETESSVGGSTRVGGSSEVIGPRSQYGTNHSD